MRPETSKMLPSQAKAVLVSYFLERLRESKLNIYADPTYELRHAIHDFDTADLYTKGIVVDCFTEARKEYDLRYPKTWSNEHQVAGRVSRGLP